MSSDKYSYTVEERAGLFGQFASAMKIAQEQQRPYETLKQALQAIIADDSIIQITPKVLADADGGKVVHVVGNYDSAADAIEAGKYTNCYGYSGGTRKEMARIPMTIQPVNRKVRISWPLGRILRVDELFDLYPKVEGPMTLLTLGVMFPKEQLEAPIFVAWKDHIGRFWYAFLDKRGTKRIVEIRQVGPSYEVDGRYYRVLLGEYETISAVSTGNWGILEQSFSVIFDPVQTFYERIKAGNYGFFNPDFSPANFPLDDEDKTGDVVFILHFDRLMHNEQVISEMSKLELRPATFTHALALGAQHKEVQTKYPIIFLGSPWLSDDGRFVPVLGVGGRERGLDLEGFGVGWSATYRFAAVRK